MLSIGGKPSGRVRESVTRQIQAAETVVAGQPSLLQLKLPGASWYLHVCVREMTSFIMSINNKRQSNAYR